MKIILKNINDLKEYPHNNRKHSEDHIKKIAESISRFGWRKAIEIDSNNYIIAGHGRLRAAKMLAFDEVPVIVNNDIDTNNRAYRIFDNKITESPDWDFEAISHEIDFLKSEDYDLIGIGLDDFLVEDIPEIEEFDPREPDEIFIKQGDLIEIEGGHRVICGDSTDKKSFESLCEGVLADMIFTDPPYNVAYEGKTKDKLTIKNDNMGDKEFFEFLLAIHQNLEENVVRGGAIYVAHAASEGVNFMRVLKESGFLLKQIIIWVKNQIVMGRRDYHWQHEPILYGWREGAAHKWFGDRKQSTVWNFNKPSSSELHPTMKPIELIAKAIGNSCPPQGVVLDCFLGSGSTLLAADQLGRKCYGIELDPKYCQVIINRFLDYKPNAEIKINGELYGKSSS